MERKGSGPYGVHVYWKELDSRGSRKRTLYSFDTKKARDKKYEKLRKDKKVSHVDLTM